VLYVLLYITTLELLPAIILVAMNPIGISFF
jgi:hypothetical protein